MNPSAAAIDVSPDAGPVCQMGSNAAKQPSMPALLPTDQRPLHRGRPDFQYHVLLLALSVAVLLPAFFLSVRGRTQVFLPVLRVPLPELCMTRRLTGLDCPGCGMTRSFIALAHGDLAAAWSYNPAGLWLFAILSFQIPFRAYQLWRIRRGYPELVISRGAQLALGIFAVALLGQWALRLSGVSF
jgi:Protein of unknown function (DUF2752)